MKKKILSILLAFLMILTSISPVLALSSDNYKVNWLVDNNYVKGYEDGSLKLANNITRAEFTKMVIAIEDLTVQATGLKDRESKFSDVSLDHWANGYINLAVEKGYIKGYEDGTFRPEEKISYQEIITILDRLHPAFDVVSTSGKDWAKAYIDFAEKYGILKDVKIADFAADAIREKAFELLYNLKHSPRIIAGERPETNKKPDTSSAEWFWIYQYGAHRPADRGYRTVKFFVDGRLYSEQEVPYGERLNFPPAPSMPGYTFQYWEVNGEKFDPNTRIYGDLNLSPRFIKNAEPTPEPDPEPSPEPEPETPELPVEFKVSYKFVSSDANKELPAEVKALLPEATTAEENTKVTPVTPTETSVVTEEGTWTFKTYNPIEVASIEADTEFVGIWVFEKKIVEYNVTYKFESKDKALTLPTEVTKQLPEATTAEENTKVTPVVPTEKTIETAEGTWKFEGYNPEEVTAIDKDIEFIGTWIFTAKAKEYNVTYKFVSADGKALPTEVEALLPEATTVVEMSSVTPEEPSKKTVTTAEGTWIFEGYNLTGVDSIDKDTEFVGTWEFTAKPKEYNVTYKFVAKDTSVELPKEVEDLLPGDGIAVENKSVTPVAPAKTSVETAEGTWTFNGYNPEKVDSIEEDTTFVGTWSFEEKEITITYVSSDETMGTVDPASETVKAVTGKANGSTAEAKDNYVFVNWTNEDGVEVGTDAKFVPKENTATTYKANFKEKEVTIKYISADPNKGTVDTAEEKVGLVSGNPTGSTATAKDNYVFVNWTDEAGDEVSTEATFVPENKAAIYTAHFEEKDVTITYVSADTNMGTVSPSSETVKAVTGNPTGSTAKANDNYVFVNWTDEAEKVVSTEAKFVPTENTETTYKANFKEKEVIIKYVSENETMGTVSPASETVSLANGTIKGSTATANQGYKFVNWTDGETVVSEKETFVPENKEAKTYTANFEEIKVKITYKVDAEMGELTIAEEEVGLATGAIKGSTAKAKDGYKFVNWTDENGAEVGTNIKFQPEDKKEATYTANFGKIVVLQLFEVKGDIPYPIEGQQKVQTSYIVQKDSSGNYNLKIDVDKDEVNRLIPKGYVPTRGNLAALNNYEVRNVNGDIIISLFLDKLPNVTVTFKSSGGNPIPSSQTILQGEKATAPTENPTKENYIFKYWELNGIEYDFSKPVEENINLVAKYDVDNTKVFEYTVNYFVKEGNNYTKKTSETLTVPKATPEVKTVKDKAPEFYNKTPNADKSTKLPFIVSETNKVINVYYDYDETQKYNITVIYYKDGEILETKKDSVYKAYPMYSFADKNIDGYVLDKTKSVKKPHKVTKDGEVLNIYYVVDDPTFKEKEAIQKNMDNMVAKLIKDDNIFIGRAKGTIEGDKDAARSRLSKVSYDLKDGNPQELEIQFNPKLNDTRLSSNISSTGVKATLLVALGQHWHSGGTPPADKLIYTTINEEKVTRDEIAEMYSKIFGALKLLEPFNLERSSKVKEVIGKTYEFTNVYQLSDGTLYERTSIVKFTNNWTDKTK